MLRKCFLVSLALVGLVGCQHPTSTPEAMKHVAAGEIGSSLPDFSVLDLQGHTLSSADLRGKVVVVDFWATWCQPCKKEMPGYQKLADQYVSRGLVVIGFKFDTMPDMEDPRVERAMMELERDMEHMDENNPRHMAHMMRKMKDLMPPGTIPKELDVAIKRLEAGEDPEKIEQDMGDLLGDFMGGEESGGPQGGGYAHDSGLYDY